MNSVDGKSQPCLIKVFARINFSHLSLSSIDLSKSQSNARENNTTRSIHFFDKLNPLCVRANRIRAHESWRQMINSLITVNLLLRAISWRGTRSAHQKLFQLVSKWFKSHIIHQILMYCLESIGTHHIDDAISSAFRDAQFFPISRWDFKIICNV